jgi:hypothetical protein
MEIKIFLDCNPKLISALEALAKALSTEITIQPMADVIAEMAKETPVLPEAPVEEPKAAKSKAKAFVDKATKAPEPVAPPPPPEEEKVTLEELREIGSAMVANGRRDDLKKILAGFGIAKIPECHPSQWAELKEALIRAE